ncbi:MAG: spore coat protein [Sporomusaceae bacterium]|nr:spore coat protein [Sporomusaceae bacterium]
MSSFVGSIFSTVSDASADQALAFTSASGAAVSAQAYFAASLAATTPEVRRLFSEYSTQSAMGHEALMGLMIKKGWVDPYSSPTQQLQNSVQQSQQTMGTEQQ